MTTQKSKSIAFSSLLAKTSTFKNEHGKRLFCDAKPAVFDEEGKAYIYDEAGETVACITFDIMLIVQTDSKGFTFVELKDVFTSLKLYPYTEQFISL